MTIYNPQGNKIMGYKPLLWTAAAIGTLALGAAGYNGLVREPHEEAAFKHAEAKLFDTYVSDIRNRFDSAFSGRDREAFSKTLSDLDKLGASNPEKNEEIGKLRKYGKFLEESF